MGTIPLGPVTPPRPVMEILEAAIQHGVDNPEHGINCACMDSLAWELRKHLPPVIDLPPSIDEWERAFDARSRIKWLLNLMARHL